MIKTVIAQWTAVTFLSCIMKNFKHQNFEKTEHAYIYHLDFITINIFLDLYHSTIYVFMCIHIYSSTFFA